MKKKYFTPTLEVVRIATSQMLAASPDVNYDPNGEVDAGDIESRFWDEDEDDDF